MNIHLQQKGEELGPFTWIEVFVMLQKGEISCETLARTDEENDWRTIDEIGLWGEGEEIGPFTWEEVNYLVSEGVLDSGVQVRREGEDALTSLAEVSESGADSPAALDSDPADHVLASESSLMSAKLVAFFDVLRGAWKIAFQRRGWIAGAALISLGFAAGWGIRGAFVAGPNKTIQGATPAMALPSAETPPLYGKEAPRKRDLVAIPETEGRESALPQADDEKGTGVEPVEEAAAKGATGATPAMRTDLPQTKLPSEVSPQSAPRSAAESQAGPAGGVSSLAAPSAAASATVAPQIERRESAKAQPVQRTAAAASKPVAKTARLRPFETPQLTEKELSEVLEERFTSTPIVVADSYDERPGVGLQIHEGSFTLETKLVHNPTVEVIYRLPQRSRNSPGPDADNIVMVGIFHGAIQPRASKFIDGKEVKEKSRLHGSLMPFADALGYTAFTLHIATTPEMASDKREYYAYGGPDWVDVVYRAKAEIERLHKLKERKLMLFGTSEGGQFAQNIAAAAPEKVAAVATQSGPDITPPETPSSAAWFLAITRGDSMQSSYEAVYNRLLGQDATVAFNIFPPDYRGRGLGGNFYHSQSAIATTASRSFLRGVMDRLDSKGNIDRTRWPYVRDRAKPLRIYSAGSAKAREIPSHLREYLPSKAFAKCLQAVPAPMQTVTLGTGGVKTMKAFVGLPPMGKPKGVMIYSQAFNFLELQHMFDNIYYLAAMGYVVIAPQMRKNDSTDLLAAMQFARTSTALRKYPMAVMGYGQKANIAWNVVARNPDIAPKAVAMLEFSPSDSFDESKLPPGSRMEAPVVFVYDENPLVDVATSEEARKSGEIVSAVKSFVTKCQERNQIAKVVIVQKPEPKKTNRPISEEEAKKLERIRVAQLSLEAAERFISNVVENKTSQIER